MNIKVDTRHLYLQVIDHIRKKINEGVYKEKLKLPSEAMLAKQLGISRATLREALRILEEDNTISRRHGVGTFINPKPVSSSGIEELSSVTEMIKEVGMEPGTIYLSKKIQNPTISEVSELSCEKNDEIVKITRVRTANGKPVVYCIDKIPRKFFPQDFSEDDISLFKLLEKNGKRKIVQAVAEIIPIGHHTKVSPILKCEPETALLVLKQLYLDQRGRPVFKSINYFKADTFSFHVLRKRV